MEDTSFVCVVAVVVSWVCLVFPVQATVGTPIIYKSTEKGPANFSFPLPENQLTHLKNPKGEEMFFVFNATKYNVASPYRDRISSLRFENGNLLFSLQNVTAADNGNYSCSKDPKGVEVILDCGQTLHFQVENQNPSEAPTSLPDKMTSIGNTLATTDTGNTGSPSEPQTQNVGAIVGGVIGGVFVLIVIVGIVCWKKKKAAGIVCWKRKRANTEDDHDLDVTHPKQPYTPDDSSGTNAGQQMLGEQDPQETRGNVSEPPEKKNEEEKPFFPRGEPSSSGTTQD